MKLTGSDIHLLSVFDSVVRNSGFSAAQVELGLSQPTISNHITALEQRLGVKLCQRGRRGFLLTEKGRMVHEIGQALLESLNVQSAHLAELKGNLVGRLRVGVVDCVNTDANCRLPVAIRHLAEQAPAVRIELTILGPQDILTGVMDGSLHVGLGSFDNVVAGLRFADLYSEDHALYCAQGHPLFARADHDLSAADLRPYARVHRSYWNRQRRKAVNLAEQDRFVHEIEAQLLMVLSGAYLGLLPVHLAAPRLADGRLRRLRYTQDDYACAMQMVTRAGRPPKVIELFTRLLKEAHEGVQN